jgi:Flp pilus assembly protein TadD
LALTVAFLSLTGVAYGLDPASGDANAAGFAPSVRHTQPAVSPPTPEPENPDAKLISLFRMGITNTDLRAVGDLIVGLRRQITDNPKAAGLRMRLGCYLYLAGDYEGAANEMKRAIALEPDNTVAHTILAKLLDDVGDPSSAQSEYQRAMQLSNKFADPHVFYAESLLRRGAISEAIDEFRRANEIKPTPYGLSGLSEALILAQDKDGAVKAARQAVSVMPNSAKAHVALTKALLSTGDKHDKQTALRTARQAALLDPASADSHLALGRALYSNAEVQDAVNEFQQAVNLDPLNAQARNDLGYALYGKGDVASALTQFQLALRLNPHLSEARNNLEIAVFGLAGKK